MTMSKNKSVPVEEGTNDEKEKTEETPPSSFPSSLPNVASPEEIEAQHPLLVAVVDELALNSLPEGEALVPGMSIPLRVLSKEEIEAILIVSSSMNYVLRILINGKNAQQTPHAFPLHEDLLQKMHLAYTRGQYTECLTHLTTYLDRIPLWTPQSGRAGQGKHYVEQILLLCEKVGYLPVVRKLLSTRMAPSSL